MTTLAQLKEQFTTVTKRIIKENLSKNIDKHKEYIIALIPAYNNLVTFVHSQYIPALSESQKQEYKYQLEHARGRFIECLRRLNIEAELSSNLLTIYDPEPFLDILDILKESAANVTIDEDDFDDIEAGTSTESKQTPLSSDTKKQTKIPILGTLLDENSGPTLSNTNIYPNMAMTIPEFLRLCGQTLNTKYDGDPLGLDSFLNAVDLLNSVATNELKETLFKFLKTRVEKTASECTKEARDTKEFLDILKKDIKHDNSKVISGRMAALKMDGKKAQEFAKQAEELSECFRRALVFEGITTSKATEMSIDKTIEMCRASSRSDVVRSILGASSFTTPKEVIAKFIIETGNDTSEKQVFAYQKFNNNKKRNFHNNNNGNKYFNKNNNSSNNNSYNNNRSRGNYRGNGRGRRGGRGNYRNYNSGQNNYNNGGGGYNVRYTENVPAPQTVDLGAMVRDFQQPQNNR